MEVVLSVTLSHLYRVLGDFHGSTDTLVQNLLLFFLFLCLIHSIGTNPARNKRFGVFNGANSRYHCSWDLNI